MVVVVADRRIEVGLTDPLTLDLTRLWQAERDGLPRPLVSRDEARVLLAEYGREGAAAPDVELAAFYWRRAEECRAALGGGR